MDEGLQEHFARAKAAGKSSLIFSATQFRTLDSCHRKWHLLKVQKMKEPPKRARAVGEAWHRVAERWLKNQEPFPADWTRVVVDKDYTERLTQVEARLMYDWLQQAVQRGFLVRQPGQAIEAKWWYRPAGSENLDKYVELTGSMDLAQPGILTDYKTMARRVYHLGREKLKKDPQILIYVLVQAAQYAFPDYTKVIVRHLNLVKDPADPEVFVSESEVLVGDARRWERETLLPALAVACRLSDDKRTGLVVPGPNKRDACREYGGCAFANLCALAPMHPGNPQMTQQNPWGAAGTPLGAGAPAATPWQQPQQASPWGAQPQPAPAAQPPASPWGQPQQAAPAAPQQAAPASPWGAPPPEQAAPASPWGQPQQAVPAQPAPASAPASPWGQPQQAAPQQVAPQQVAPQQVAPQQVAPQQAAPWNPQQAPAATALPAPGQKSQNRMGVVVEPAPWADPNCIACKGVGVNSSLEPCRICDGTAAARQTPPSSFYTVRYDPDREALHVAPSGDAHHRAVLAACPPEITRERFVLIPPGATLPAQASAQPAAQAAPQQAAPQGDGAAAGKRGRPRGAGATVKFSVCVNCLPSNAAPRVKVMLDAFSSEIQQELLQKHGPSTAEMRREYYTANAQQLAGRLHGKVLIGAGTLDADQSNLLTVLRPLAHETYFGLRS